MPVEGENLRRDMLTIVRGMAQDVGLNVRVRLNGDDGIGPEGVTPEIAAGLAADQLDVVLGFGQGRQIQGADLPDTLDRLFWLWIFDDPHQGFHRIWSVALGLREALNFEDVEIDGFGTMNIQFVTFGDEMFSPESILKRPRQRDLYRLRG